MRTHGATTAPLTASAAFKENFDLFYLLIKGTWKCHSQGRRAPEGGRGSTGRGAPKDSRMWGAAGRPSPLGQRGCAVA